MQVTLTQPAMLATTDSPVVVALPSGHTIEVRPMSHDDCELLAGFYRTLPAEDLQLRFFSAFQPPQKFLDDWASATDRGGFSVVAVLDADGARSAIGEAGYMRLDNGDAELGVAVARPWRGWLGAFLVDVVARHAAAQGIPGLEADVLCANTPMIRLLGHRGMAVVGHWVGTVRLVVGTDGTVPTWPPAEARPRVLVEVAGGRWSAEKAAREAGLATLSCPGRPGRATRRCPVLGGGNCPLVAGADAIVLLFSDGQSRDELIAAHRCMHPGVPILVAPAPDGAVPEGCMALPEGDPDAAVRALVSAIGTTRAADTPQQM